MKKNRNRSYTNGQITIIWQGEKCTHSTMCYTRLRSVFDPIKRPWIDPNGASTEQILSVIADCPSDALTFRWNDENRNQSEESPKLFRGSMSDLFGDISAKNAETQTVTAAKVDLRPNGPIVISGEFEVVDEGQELRQMQMISLCRCGQSRSMPICDGTHFKIGFKTK